LSGESTYELDDPRALKALAHPLRGKLLAALRVDGPATASSLGRRYGESSGATSYHLRVLARYGFVEDDPEHSDAGRERWWRAAHTTTTFWPGTLLEERPEAAEVAREFMRRVGWDYGRYLQRFAEELEDWSPAWRDAVVISDRFMHLSVGQLASLRDELEATLRRYAALEPDDDDNERVVVALQAFPQRGPMQ
jgi:DNA-binding transcriptional ArsR family regulator